MCTGEGVVVVREVLEKALLPQSFGVCRFCPVENIVTVLLPCPLHSVLRGPL